jgi:16S rRNA (guanine966-N2)-methyltransferase
MPARDRPRIVPGVAARASAGRVIAGSARGTRLFGPGEGTRPLGDRVKQTLFAILEPWLRDRPFLDLYAGSGAAGIEALSRGAARAVFVESDRKAVRAIDQNLAATGFAAPQAIVAAARVAAWIRKHADDAKRSGAHPQDPFAVVFVDPPYDAPAELERTVAAIAGAGPGAVLARDGILVAKHFWRQPPAGDPLLASFRQERFGETMLTFHRWADEVAAHGEAS